MNTKLRMAVFAMCSMTWAGRAAAQPASGLADQYRFSLGASVLSHESAEREPEGGGDQDVSITNVGLPAGIVDVQLAYGLSDTLALGGTLILTRSASETEAQGVDSETAQTDLVFGPLVDFYFGDNDASLRPFVSANAAFALVSREDGELETSLSGFQLGGRVGLRWFVLQQLSLDPTLGVSWTSLSGEQEQGAAEADLDISSIKVGLDLYVSLWM
jgi:hypothetical protein